MPKEKINTELLDKLSPEALRELYDGVYEVMCQTILRLLKNTSKNLGLTEEEIKAAREVAELKPDNEAARKLLEFLESGEVKKAVFRKIDL